MSTDAKVTSKERTKALREISREVKKAKKELLKLDGVMEELEKDALAGIKAVVDIVGREPVGKLSPLGHRADCQNGLLDMVILNSANTEEVDFEGWVKTIIKANPKMRKSNISDNKALLRRLTSHYKSIVGIGKTDFTKRLANVGKSDKAKEIMSLLLPSFRLFERYVKSL